MCFDSIIQLICHKRHYCKLRFTCKCEDEKDILRVDNSLPGILQCSSCNQDFKNPWDLMEHVQVMKPKLKLLACALLITNPLHFKTKSISISRIKKSSLV